MVQNARILVVDDDPSLRLTMEEILTRDGHAVTTVDSGQAALELITTQTFDLALVDLKLGDMEGTDVLAALQQQSPDTVPIMLTGHASLETAVEALRHGAHDYLFKPYQVLELRESIRRGLLKHRQQRQQRHLLHQLEEHLSSKLEDIRAIIGDPEAEGSPGQPAPELEQEQARFLQRGSLIVDFLRHVITLDGHLLELSPTEFGLLAYMVSEAPRAIPPQELVCQVQGYESEEWEASETMRSHVYHIRQKIKKATGRTDVIRTVRGVGYSIG